MRDREQKHTDGENEGIGGQEEVMQMCKSEFEIKKIMVDELVMCLMDGCAFTSFALHTHPQTDTCGCGDVLGDIQ